MKRYRPTGTILSLSTALLLSAAGGVDAAVYQSDFAFGEGTPYEGEVQLGDLFVELTSTNTEPNGDTSFRDDLSAQTATVTLSFSEPVIGLDLTVGAVGEGERIAGVGLGDPVAVTGSLEAQPDGSVTVAPGTPVDSGYGTISWSFAAVSSLTLTVDSPPSAAVALLDFAVTTPEPAMSGAALLLLAGLPRRSRRRPDLSRAAGCSRRSTAGSTARY